MHKFNRFIISVLLSILILQTACGNKIEIQPDDVSSDVSGVVEEDFQNDAQGECITRLADTAQNADEQGILKYIPNPKVEQGSQQEVLILDDNLVLWSTGYSAEKGPYVDIALLSMETGEVLVETSFSDFKQADVQICDDKLSITDWTDGKIRILDESLNLINEYDLNTGYAAIYLSPNTETAYIFFSENGLYAMDLASGSRQLLLENTTELYVQEYCGENVTISYLDLNTQMTVNRVLNLVTGTVSEIPFTGAFYNVQSADDIWLAGVFGSDIGEYYLGKHERPSAFVPSRENTMVTLLNDPARIMIKNFGSNGIEGITLYEVDGHFLSQVTFGNSSFILYNNPVWSAVDGGYFFVMEEGRKDRLYFWDMSAPVSGMDLQLQARYEGVEPGTEVSAELYERAASLSETYGVTIKIAEQVDTQSVEYLVQPELDETYISAALDEVEKVFSVYPEGFFEQLSFGNQYEIEVQLSGVLARTDVTEESTGFTSYGGFAFQDEGKNVIVVDIAGPGFTGQILHHEIAHLIDYKMEFDASVRKDAVYSEEGWMNLNPDDFAYADTTIDLPMSFYTDGYDEWFIDLYSRTTIYEDRARIMEYAVVGDEWGLGTSQRQEKLKYWCQCIRDSFDTTGWPELTVWEETLERLM